IPSLLENLGIKDNYVLIVWDNGSNAETVKVLKDLQKKYKFGLFLNNKNIGQQAYGSLIELDIVKASDYFIWLEDDMIWFSPNWLANLVKAFKTKPIITKAGKKMGAKEEWGVLATNVLVDRVNNGGMWRKRFERMIEHKIGGIHFWLNVRAGAGAIIFKTEKLQELKEILKYTTEFSGMLCNLLNKYNDEIYPMAHVRDTYIYHAASPFFNQLYPKVWETKQSGETIAQAMEQYEEAGNFQFKGNEWILEELKKGKFENYAKKLHKLHQRGKGRIYSFEFEEWGRRNAK
ncbi:hypothetical protein LCGC14_1872190, partial [marine sediment metagenome]